MSLSPLLLEDDLFVVSILRDTVARAQEDAAKQRTELLVILGQLAAAVSHQIRNPLQSLSLHADIAWCTAAGRAISPSMSQKSAKWLA